MLLQFQSKTWLGTNKMNLPFNLNVIYCSQGKKIQFLDPLKKLVVMYVIFRVFVIFQYFIVDLDDL